jgi:hypothetical protein
MKQVILGDAVVFNRIANQATQKGDIRGYAQLAKEIGDTGSARKARIYHNHFCVARAFGLDSPLEAAGMVFRRVAAHDQHHVGILDIDPAIGHCAPAVCWSQT